MKRTIPRSLVSKALNQSAEPSGNDDEAKVDTAPPSTTAAFKGAGSAWKAGALAQSQAAVEQGRAQLVEDILNGRHELRSKFTCRPMPSVDHLGFRWPRSPVRQRGEGRQF